MEKRINLRAEALKYVLPHVSTDVSRMALQAVCCEPSGLIVATDGCSLAFHRSGAEPFNGPSELIAFDKPKGLTAAKIVTVRVTFDDRDNMGRPMVANLLNSAGTIIGAATCYRLDASFPDWRKVYNPSNSGGFRSISLRSDLLARFTVKTGSDDGNPILARFDSHDSATLIQWPREPEAMGLVMPVLAGEDMRKEDALSAWRRLSTI